MGRSESPLTTGAHSPSHHHHHVADDADHEEDISRKQKPRPLYACRGFRLLGLKEGAKNLRIGSLVHSSASISTFTASHMRHFTVSTLSLLSDEKHKGNRPSMGVVSSS